MNEPIPSPFFENIGETVGQINQLAAKMGLSSPVFLANSRRPLVYSCHEAGFLRATSWLYTLYYEDGRISVTFLLDRLSAYSLDQTGFSRRHYKNIHDLRTVLQHSLDSADSRDGDLLACGRAWLLAASGTSDPTNDSEWAVCLRLILTEGLQFLTSLYECLQQITNDEFCSPILSEWNYRLSRYVPPEEYDRVISIAANDMGLGFVNPIKIRNRYSDVWSRELDALTGSYDRQKEIRKRVEQVLLSMPVRPITGDDIIRWFGIPPGRQVADLLRKAEAMYLDDPCGPDELLARLSQTLATDQVRSR